MSITTADLRRLLPHRYPFLLVDAVVACEPGVRLVARKVVTHDEPFFAGDLVRDPVMPDMLVLESMAQAGGVLLMAEADDPTRKVVYFASLDAVQWHGDVRPGDELRLEVVVTKRRATLRKVRAEARVADMLVCEGELAAVLADR
ncbi:MAG TPA: 3-hydroxyacyl-ACP dehydratase FabZ [Gemmatirosa sp.]